MSVMSSLHVHKVSMPCEYSGPMAWSWFSPHHLQVSRRREARVYAASSWWGFATADDRKRLQAVIRCGIRSGLCGQHHKTVEELVEEADDKLFTNVTYNKHVLHSTLPGTMDTKYHLRPRPLDPIILRSPLRIARLLNVILLPGCFLMSFIDIFDIIFLSLLSCIDILI